MRIRRSKHDRDFALAALAAGALVLAFTLWLRFRFGGVVLTERVDDLGEAVAALIASLVCGLAAGRRTGHYRLGWSLIGLMALSWGIGELVWSYYEVILGRQVPFPSFADLGYLAAVPFAVLGVLVFTSRVPAGVSRLATTLDGSIMAGSLLLLSWVTVLGSVYHPASENLFALMISLAYPVSDVIVLTMVLLLIGRVSPSDRVSIFLLAGGLFANLLSDSVFTYLTAQSGYGSVRVIDAGWVAGFLLVALAALRALREREAPASSNESGAGALRLFVLPYSPLAVGVGSICVRNLLTGSIDAFLFWDMMLVALLVILRQFIVLKDNLDLTLTLRAQTMGLAEREEQLRSLIEHSTDVATLVDAEGLIRFQSASARRVFAYDPGELVGHPLIDLVHPADRARLQEALSRALKASGHPTSVDVRVRHKLGSWSPCEVTITNLVYLPSVESLVVNIRDIAERKQLEERVAHQLSHDALTNLPNRSSFRDRLERAFSDPRAVGLGVAVLFIDVDDFGRVNTAYGHEIGDELLAAIGARLQQQVRPDDLVARWASDEFVILLQGVATDDLATKVATRILDQFQPAFTAGGQSIRVSACMGGARGLAGEKTPDQLVKDADFALRLAKSGKGRFEWYSPGMTASAPASEAADAA